jgi:uncharacterized protein YggE
MKHILLITASCLAALNLFSQASGNAVNQNTNQSGAGNNEVFISTVGNVNAVNCSGNATTLSGNATTTGGSSYNWNANSNLNGVNFTTQAKQYYNPYTGKYEDTPNNGGTQAQAALPYDNSVIFDADVMINMKASSYTAIFSVTDFGKTVIQADSAMSARLKVFTDAMVKDSILAENIHIDFISMLPVYEVEAQNKVFSNIATEVPAGFKIKKNVHVMFFDHTKLDQIITHAAKASIYDLVKVDYNVNDIQAAYDTLRKIAVEVIDMKRNTYAMMGFETTIMAMAEGYDSKYPEERYESYTAYLQGNSFNSAQNPNMTVQTAEKEQTVFYNKVPYKQFDRVLNADLAEPGVQFYYKLRVKCKMEHIEEEKKDPKGTSTAGATKAPGAQPAKTNTGGGNVPAPAGTYQPKTTIK